MSIKPSIAPFEPQLQFCQAFYAKRKKAWSNPSYLNSQNGRVKVLFRTGHLLPISDSRTLETLGHDIQVELSQERSSTAKRCISQLFRFPRIRCSSTPKNSIRDQLCFTSFYPAAYIFSAVQAMKHLNLFVKMQRSMSSPAHLRISQEPTHMLEIRSEKAQCCPPFTPRPQTSPLLHGSPRSLAKRQQRTK